MNPFWTFSLALYDQPGVAAACIELQDRHGLDVNLVLFACYASARGIRLAPADIDVLEDTVADIRETLVKPVRVLRRHASELGESDVKQALLSAELAAEEAQQAIMWRVGQSLGTAADPVREADLLRANLQLVSGESLESFALLVIGLLPLAMAQ